MSQTTLVLRPHQIPLFIAAVEHNKRMLQEQCRTRRFCNQDYYFVAVENGELVLILPGTHDMDLTRSVNDYIAGALVGALPFIDLHGSDGIKIDECGNITQVELKLCMKAGTRYEINDSGKITIIGGTGGVRSDGAAHYEIVDNLEKKNVSTYFVMFDKTTYELIQVYRMTGDNVIELIGKNQNTGEDKSSKKRSITLSAFMKHGQKVFQDVLPAVGVEEWEHRIYHRCGRNPSEGEPVWTVEKNAVFAKLYTNNVPIEDIMVVFPGRTKKAIQSHAKKLKLRRSY